MRSYLDLLEDVLENGEDHADRTGVGTKSVFIRQWKHDMKAGFPLLTTKKVPLRWVFEELRWFLSGSTNEKDLAKTGVDIWKEWATEEQCAKFGRSEGDLGPVYGNLWRDFLNEYVDIDAIVPAILKAPGSGDQIANLLNDIEKSPESRRLIVTGWHPEKSKQVALPPCHTLFQLKCHSNQDISLHLYARSIDIFLGLPFNIASYGLLLHMIAWATGRKPRTLGISFGDLHLYKNHIAQAVEQLNRDPHRLPTVTITKETTGNPLADLLSLKWEDIVLEGYDPQPAISAPVAV